jgi:hypothetical protein
MKFAAKTKLPKRITAALASWQKQINLALEEGKGKYFPFTYVGDLWDYKYTIESIADGNVEAAADFVWSLDTSSREAVPATIYDWLMKHR